MHSLYRDAGVLVVFCTFAKSDKQYEVCSLFVLSVAQSSQHSRSLRGSSVQ